MAPWWNEFIEAVTDGAWTATLLQGLISGAAAIAVALFILRHQLAADRLLAKNERAEMQRIAQEQKYAAAAASIGRILVQVALSVRELSNRDLGALLRRTSKPLDLDLVNTAKIEAAIYFPYFPHHVAVARLKERDALWTIGRNAIDLDPTLTDEAIGHALRHALAPANNDLRAVGNELIRWSGAGDFPDGLSVISSIDPLPTTRQAKTPVRATWKARAFTSIVSAANTRRPRPTASV